MPTKEKPGREAPRDLPAIPKELIDQFVNGLMSAEAIQDALMAFKKALIERALGAELGITLVILKALSALKERATSVTAGAARQC